MLQHAWLPAEQQSGPPQLQPPKAAAALGAAATPNTAPPTTAASVNADLRHFFVVIFLSPLDFELPVTLTSARVSVVPAVAGKRCRFLR